MSHLLAKQENVLFLVALCPAVFVQFNKILQYFSTSIYLFIFPLRLIREEELDAGSKGREKRFSRRVTKPNGMRRQDDKITGLGSQASRHPEQ
jgi:hypothetical protein